MTYISLFVDSRRNYYHIRILPYFSDAITQVIFRTTLPVILLIKIISAFPKFAETDHTKYNLLFCIPSYGEISTPIASKYLLFCYNIRMGKKYYYTRFYQEMK